MNLKFSSGKARLLFLGFAVWLIFGLFALRLVTLQIVDGASYLAQQQQGSSRTQVIRAARGEILDRNGQPFTYNEVAYNIVFDQTLAPKGMDNETILRLINILRQSNESWIDSLPLTPQPPFTFTDNEAEVARIKGKDYLNLNTYASASETFHWVKERYGLSIYSELDARAIAGVRYEMEKKGYSLSVRYTFAENVSLETAVLIRQLRQSLPGVDIVEIARRRYMDGDLAPHIIGRVGAIFPDELESYLSMEKGYTREDQVGKEGIERAFEDRLRGTDGIRRIDLDATNRIIGIEEERAAIPGYSIITTLDKTLQRVSAEALQNQIDNLNQTALPGEGKEANAGAVAVIDIKTGEVLACVTYPSYNLETYSADYAENASNPLYPFLNRTLSGIYAPGSTFKPVVAVAGLNEGLITPHSHVLCQRIYTFFPSYQPGCLGFHGNYTVVEALRASCNIFFYDTGRQLGIDKTNQYARALGLGSPTGIELSEATGSQTNPNSINPGDALQTAIGQLDNGYSPLQLANYTATLARNGQRLKLTLIRSISSYYDWTDTTEKHQVEVISQINASAGVFETVREGMVAATHSPYGTAYSYLGDYPITVASKTGTPQTRDFPNSTFICYAPAEDPQIAIAVVIERGWHGYTGAPVARAILDAYFFPNQDSESSEESEPSPAPIP